MTLGPTLYILVFGESILNDGVPVMPGAVLSHTAVVRITFPWV